jgi:hypothetical protein
MSAEDPLVQHTTRWGFRRRAPFEGAEQYRTAAVAFLETRDWAAAHEVRLGKGQADWTPAEVQAFQDHLLAKQRPAHDAPVTALFMEMDVVPCTLAALLDVARIALDLLADLRRKDVIASLPIFAHVIALDGRLLVAPCSSDDRIAVLRAATRTLPLYGYVLVFDAFAHAITPGVAKKRDVLLAHVGTREERRCVQRAYTVSGSRVRFDADQEIDMKAPTSPDGVSQRFTDPYAELFVSVPPPARPQ